MNQNFDKALPVVLKHEGGFVDHPADPGGATNKGITLATYRRFKPGASVEDLKQIGDDALRFIYKTDYWTPAYCNSHPTGFDLAVFDYAVNSGPARASVAAKRFTGPVRDNIKGICAQRLSFVQGLRTWKVFGRGWARRIADIEATAVAWHLAAIGVTDQMSKVATRAEGAEAARRADGHGTKAKGSGAAGGAAGGGGAAVDATSNKWAAIALIVMAVVGIAAMAYFLWRSRVERERATAYVNVGGGQ